MRNLDRTWLWRPPLDKSGDNGEINFVLVLYEQTSEQLLSSGCETQLIISTQVELVISTHN